jgi:hypothetical protein
MVRTLCAARRLGLSTLIALLPRVAPIKTKRAPTATTSITGAMRIVLTTKPATIPMRTGKRRCGSDWRNEANYDVQG